MRTILILYIILCCTNVYAQSNIIGTKRITVNGIRYDVYVADLTKSKVRLHLINDKTGKHFQTLNAVKAHLNANGIQPAMLMNAGMYMENNEPLGLYIEEDKKHTTKLNTRGKDAKGNFYLQPNGVFYIDKKGVAHIDTTAQVAALQKAKKFDPKLATQSGPMLLINGRVNGNFTKGSFNINFRNGVGIINDKKVVFAIAVDPCNFYDFAAMFKETFGCKNALYMDGAISQMYLRDIAPNVLDGNLGPIISVSDK